MSQGKGLIGIALDAPLLQLKAYYISHLDANTKSLLEQFGLVEPFKVEFPEWVIPLCALAAGLISIAALLRWTVVYGRWAFRWVVERWQGRRRTSRIK